MNPPSDPTRKELEILFQDFEDGTLGAEGRERLHTLMAESREVRKAYCRHMLFSSSLHSIAKRQQSFADEDLIFYPWSSGRKRIVVALLSAAAVLLVGAVVLSLFTAKNIPPASVRTSEGAVWSFVAGGVDEKRDFQKFSELHVDQGILEMTFSSGTKIHVQAPSELVVLNRKKVMLRSGNLWVAVAEGDKGFEVITKKLRAIDLGTEFGISSSRRSDEVHVGKGLVRVESLLVGQQPMKLPRGRAVASDSAGRLSTTEYAGTRFSKNLKIPKVRVAHWSFEGKEPMKAKTSMGHSPVMHVARLWGDSGPPEFTGSVTGKALDLTAEGLFARAAFEVPMGGEARSVAFWIRKQPAEADDPTAFTWLRSSILGWGSTSATGGQWKVKSSHDGTSVSSVWGRSWRISKFTDKTSIYDGEWHHVATVFTGGGNGKPEIRHYVDGVLREITTSQAGSEVNTLRRDDGWAPITIGLFEEKGFRQEANPLQIDELVITNSVIPESVIARMAACERFDIVAELSPEDP